MAFLREIRTKRKSGKVYSYWVVIKSFWDKKKRKVRHRIIHNLGTLSKEEEKTIRIILSLKGMPKDSFFTTFQGNFYFFSVKNGKTIKLSTDSLF